MRALCLQTVSVGHYLMLDILATICPVSMSVFVATNTPTVHCLHIQCSGPWAQDKTRWWQHHVNSGQVEPPGTGLWVHVDRNVVQHPNIATYKHTLQCVTLVTTTSDQTHSQWECKLTRTQIVNIKVRLLHWYLHFTIIYTLYLYHLYRSLLSFVVRSWFRLFVACS